jgi:hypothetical protein
MRASIARRRAEGRPVGRGSVPDRAPRSTAGYFDAWEPGGARREAEGRTSRGEAPGDQAHARQREARRNARRYTRAELLAVAEETQIPGCEQMSRDQLASAIWQRGITLDPKP